MLGMTDVHDLPLRTAVDHYLVALRVEGAAPTTIETYRSVLASYLRWATTNAAPTLADFTLLQVRGYVAHLMGEHVRFAHHHNVRAGGRLSDYTINLHGRVLRTFAAWLAREEYTDQHVLARFKPLRPRTKPIVPLTPEEFKGMVAALTGPASLRARGRAMLFLLFDTGIRASELADIRLGDLDLEAGILRVRGKGSQRQRVKWRTVGMGVRAQRALQQYAFRYRPPAIPVGEERVFLTRHGRRMTRNTVHRFVKRLGRQAGVERAHPHLFRHSTGVAFLRSGGSESVLQRILGHASREMVEHYMHLADTDVTQLHRRHSPLDHL